MPTPGLGLLRKLLTPPDLPDPEDRRQAAAVLGILVPASVVVAALAASTPFLSDHLNPALTLRLGLLALMVTGVWLAHRGRPHLVTGIVIPGLWVLVTIMISVTGGNRSPAVVGYFLLLMAAGYLWGRRGGLLALGILLFNQMYAGWPNEDRGEHLRPIIARLQQDVEANGGSVYVLYGARPAFQVYYSGDMEHVRIGRWFRERPLEEKMADVLPSFSDGGETWFVASHYGVPELTAITEQLQERCRPTERLQESNALAMHATMIDTRPPVLYWLPESLEAMRRVWALRDAGTPVYFTMDAGPNLKLLFTEEDQPVLTGAFHKLDIIAPF